MARVVQLFLALAGLQTRTMVVLVEALPPVKVALVDLRVDSRRGKITMAWFCQWLDEPCPSKILGA